MVISLPFVAECDVLILGIFHFFMESEKFGSEKEVSNRSFKHFLFFLYLHHNFLVRILLWVWVSEIILHRKNSWNWSRRQFGTKKGLETGLGQIFFVTHCYGMRKKKLDLNISAR